MIEDWRSDTDRRGRRQSNRLLSEAANLQRSLSDRQGETALNRPEVILVAGGPPGGRVLPGELGRIQQRGQEFAVPFGIPAGTTSINAHIGIQSCLRLQSRLDQLNNTPGGGAQPGNNVSRGRIQAFLRGLNEGLHDLGLHLELNWNFNPSTGQVRITEGVVHRWENDLRGAALEGRIQIPAAQVELVNRLRGEARTLAQEVAARLPASGNADRSAWLTNALSERLSRDNQEGGQNRVRLFVTLLKLELNSRGFDMTPPTAEGHVRFHRYDYQSQRRGQSASDLLTVNLDRANPGNSALTIEQQTANRINQNWANSNDDGGPAGLAQQFWNAYNALNPAGQVQFLSRLNAALSAQNRSVDYDPHLRRLILCNGRGDGRAVAREVDLPLGRPEDDRPRHMARDLDLFFRNPPANATERNARLLQLAQRFNVDGLAYMPGANQFRTVVNAFLNGGRGEETAPPYRRNAQEREVQFDSGTQVFRLLRNGTEVARIEVPVEQPVDPNRPVPPGRDAVQRATQIATLINGNWANPNNDADVLRQFQSAYTSQGGAQFVTRLNQILAVQNRSISYDEGSRQLVLYNGTGNSRTEHRRIQAAGFDFYRDIVGPGLYVGGAGLALLTAFGVLDRVTGGRLSRYIAGGARGTARGTAAVYRWFRPLTGEPGARVTDSAANVPHQPSDTTGTQLTQSSEEARDVSARQPRPIEGATPQARRQNVEVALQQARAQNPNSPFFNNDTITDYRARCLEFSNFLASQTAPGDRAQQLTDFIRETGRALFPDHADLFSRIRVVENPHAHEGTTVAEHTFVHGTDGQISEVRIALPRNRLSGTVSEAHLHETLGSLYDQLYRVHRQATLSTAANTEAAQTTTRRSGNALADFVQFSVRADNTVSVDQHANEARVALHGSRTVSGARHGYMEIHSDGRMSVANEQGRELTDPAARERTLIDQVAREIEQMRTRRQQLLDTAATLTGDANRQAREALEAQARSLGTQVEAAQARHATLTSTTDSPARTTARQTLSESFRRAYERGRARIGGRVVPLAMFAEEAVRWWLTH